MEQWVYYLVVLEVLHLPFLQDPYLLFLLVVLVVLQTESHTFEQLNSSWLASNETFLTVMVPGRLLV